MVNINKTEKTVLFYAMKGNKEIKESWEKPLTNDERIEILFMKIQELEEKINKYL